MPEVFSPVGNLVVSDRVKELLHWVPNVEFLRVEFGKLTSIPYAAGQVTARCGHLDPLATTPELFFDRLPDEPALRANVGKYFEVVSPRISDVQGDYKDLREFRCQFTKTVVHADLDLLFSRRLLTDYPIIWQFKVILADRVFEIVSPFVNWDYYEVQEVVVDA